MDTLNLEIPPEESEFEVTLAKKTGLDGLLRHLQVAGTTPDDAVAELANAKLTELETKAEPDTSSSL